MTLSVVKLGGSYAHSPRLAEVVESLAHGAGRTVVVPGGGPFADCVRVEQARFGYDDRAAHRLALLAMAQFGLALASPFLSPLGRGRLAKRAGEGAAPDTEAPPPHPVPSFALTRPLPKGERNRLSQILVPARSIGEISAKLEAKRVPVWLPLDLLDGDPDIPECWDMTSDSLAVWLAGKLAAARLIFLKQVEAPAAATAADLAALGVLDPLAPRFLAETPVETWLCGPRGLAGLGAALAGGGPCGRRIVFA